MNKLLFHLFDKKQPDNAPPVEDTQKSVSDLAQVMDKLAFTAEAYQNLFENALGCHVLHRIGNFKNNCSK